ncbi:MAG: T9SS C-terminal target domain-containing protein [Candidatus Kapaibacterium sp.]
MNFRRITTSVCAILALLGAASTASAQAVPGAVQLSGSLTSNRTLSADSVYQITGLLKVESGVVLTIPKGTLIYGDNRGTQNGIQVQQGGRIEAQGTKNCPIIMTSAIPQGSRAGGDWAGVILLGNAPINNGPTATIEGGTGGVYGGTNAADNSGTLKYVRIEYAGSLFSANNEINSLTMGGVGSGTTIDYVQCSYGLDDAFEWFGGTVNVSHLVAFGTLDDNWDTDNGYSGIGQWLFGFRDITKSDISTSNGMEADNDATGSTNTPLSHPKFANMTEVGPFYDGSTATGIFGRVGHWRRNTDYQLYNSVLTGYDEGIRLDGAGIAAKIAGAAACPQPGSFEAKGVYVSARTTALNAVSGVNATDAANWFGCTGASNANSLTFNTAGLLAVGQANLNNPDPRPSTTAPPATGGVTLPGVFGGRTSTSYRGAFDPSVSRDQQWDAKWTNYDPQRTTYVKHKIGWNLVALANAPSSPNNHKDSIYDFNSSNAFKFDPVNGYQTENSMNSKVGYFLKLDSNCVVEQVGNAVALPTSTASLPAGWNIVATGASVYATPANTKLNGSTVSLTFFEFDPVAGYLVASTLTPGKAYFVELPAGGGVLQFNP